MKTLLEKIMIRRPPFLRRPAFFGSLCLLLVTIAAYGPALRGGFIWDDDIYVTQNAALRSLEGLWKIWFDVGAVPQYYPVAYSGFWVQYHLWGTNPPGYHLVNAVLHGLNAVLLWLALCRLLVPGAWLAAAIFALHPVHVESVAWITELKNVLSGFFYLAALWAYLRFLRIPAGETRTAEPWEKDDGTRKFYFLSLFLYLCAVLSKTVACSLPAAILLLIWWKRGRVAIRNLLDLVPFFCLALGAGLTTAWVEKHFIGAAGEDWSLPFLERGLVAGRALWFYAAKLFWPLKLAFIYPRWQIDSGSAGQYFFPLAWASALVALWAGRRRFGKAPLAAALFFTGTLFPALGFFDVYPMRFSFVADHFQYLASIGLIAAFSAGATAIGATGSARGVDGSTRPANCGGAGGGAVCRPLTEFWNRLTKGSALLSWRPGLGAVLLCVLGALTWRQGAIYRDRETLWRDTLKKNPGCWMAHNNLGHQLLDEGKPEEAVVCFQRAVDLKPDYIEALYNLGIALFKTGRYEEAVVYDKLVVQFRPHFAAGFTNLGNALWNLGRLEEAVNAYQKALSLAPDLPEAHIGLGNALSDQGRFADAEGHFAEAFRLDPGSAETHYNWGIALGRWRKRKEAELHFEEALRINPNFFRAHVELGNLFLQEGDLARSAEHFQEALRADPSLSGVHGALGIALFRQGRSEEAFSHFREALRLSPKDAGTRVNYGKALFESGRWEEAIGLYREALRLDPSLSAARENLELARVQQNKRRGKSLPVPVRR